VDLTNHHPLFGCLDLYGAGKLLVALSNNVKANFRWFFKLYQNSFLLLLRKYS
jgi:hypothetical protein